MTHAPIALTVGDPAGIGPEIAAMAWNKLRGDVPFFWIGDPAHISELVAVREISSPRDAIDGDTGALPILPMSFDGPRIPGQPDPRHAHSVIAAIKCAVELAKTGEVSAICTGPIHKKALIDGADFAYPGHTEFLAALAGVRHVVMMLASNQLRVVPATIHIPLSEVPGQLTQELLENTLRITHAALRRDFGIASPRIAVAGLNPHAGEGGAMGHEDQTVIAPVINKLSKNGMDVVGPRSADTMFHVSARARYDVAICAYHDQALIPIKTLDFDKGVNVTLGLPFIRTSPDHGTAFDIAGTGAANPSSLIEALRMAWELVTKRAKP